MKKEELPNPETINHAKDLAFFADELLSEEILKSEEKLLAYIKRHANYRNTNIVSDKDLIKAANEAQLFSDSMQILDKRSRQCFFWLMFKTGFLPAFLFAMLALYFLTTPIEHWFWSLGSYNQVILEFFPRAQNWVNISFAYREKMIILFACFTVLLVFSIVYMLLLIFQNRQVLVFEYVDVKKAHICHKYNGVMITIIIPLIVGMSVIGGAISVTYFGGSDTFLETVAYRKGIYSDYRHWNTLFGFVALSSQYMFFVVVMLQVIFISLGFSRYCKKINKFKLVLNKELYKKRK